VAGSEPLNIEESESSESTRQLADQLNIVEAAVGLRQDSSVLNQVLQATKEPGARPIVKRSPAAPFGKIQASSSTSMDARNKAYYSLLKGPYQLTSTDGMDASKHRDIVNVPDFVGTGATLAWWYRHIPCLTEDCGTFLFVKSCDDKAWAWAAWTENSAFWSSFASGYPRDFVEEKFQLNGILRK